ncbi:MAG: VanZ family protein [Betaproteobacteria bacterium]
MLWSNVVPFDGIALLVRRAWWAVGWFGVALCIYLTLMPSPPTLNVAEGDKLQHIAAYVALMFWFVQLTADLRTRRRTALALVGLGVALEFAQLATSYREFSVADMAADAVGVALGWLLAPPRLPNFLQLTQRVGAFLAGR